MGHLKTIDFKLLKYGVTTSSISLLELTFGTDSKTYFKQITFFYYWQPSSFKIFTQIKIFWFIYSAYWIRRLVNNCFYIKLKKVI